MLSRNSSIQDVPRFFRRDATYVSGPVKDLKINFCKYLVFHNAWKMQNFIFEDSFSTALDFCLTYIRHYCSLTLLMVKDHQFDTVRPVSFELPLRRNGYGQKLHKNVVKIGKGGTKLIKISKVSTPIQFILYILSWWSTTWSPKSSFQAIR